MGLSDCIKCWMTPCDCGHEYRNWGKSAKDELVKAVQGYTTKDILEWIQTSAPYHTDAMMELTPEEIETLYLNQNKDE